MTIITIVGIMAGSLAAMIAFSVLIEFPAEEFAQVPLIASVAVVLIALLMLFRKLVQGNPFSLRGALSGLIQGVIAGTLIYIFWLISGILFGENGESIIGQVTNAMGTTIHYFPLAACASGFLFRCFQKVGGPREGKKKEKKKKGGEEGDTPVAEESP